jgi:hypothetical protein
MEAVAQVRFVGQLGIKYSDPDDDPNRLRARDTWISLRVDIRHNPLSMGNRGVAYSRYSGPKVDKSYLDESYQSDLPKEPATPLQGFHILFNREY